MIDLLTLIVIAVLFLVFVVPWTAYSAAKLGVMGLLRGRELFDELNRDRKKKGKDDDEGRA